MWVISLSHKILTHKVWVTRSESKFWVIILTQPSESADSAFWQILILAPNSNQQNLHFNCELYTTRPLSPFLNYSRSFEDRPLSFLFDHSRTFEGCPVLFFVDRPLSFFGPSTFVDRPLYVVLDRFTSTPFFENSRRECHALSLPHFQKVSLPCP